MQYVIKMNFDTQFKKQLIERLRGKELSENSIRLYVRNLERLNDDSPLKSLAFLKNVDEVASKLQRYKDNTKRGYLISIVSALSTDKDTKAKEKLYNTYHTQMMNKDKEIRQKPENADNEKTPQQRDNWIDWKDVQDKVQELERRVEGFAKSKELNEHNYNTLLSYVVLSLYVETEPRRNQDYQKMQLVKADDAKLPISNNYLALDDGLFIFNVFKTARKMGQQRIEVPDKLQRVVATYLKHHPLVRGRKLQKGALVPFLVYYDGTPFDKVNSITRILNKVFGKKVGSSMLRHAFLSNKFGDVNEEQKEVAERMAHTTAQQREYIKK